MNLRAKLDALFFKLYGITDRNTINYVYSTFPIVEGEGTQAYGRYLSRDLCLACMNALAVGIVGSRYQRQDPVQLTTAYYVSASAPAPKA